LIESHLPLVRAVAKRYAGRGEALDDLVQVGAVGLIKASDRFDPGRGISFAAFAAPAVEGEIRRHLGDSVTSLRIPRALQRMTGELRRCRAELSASLGRSPTTRELADALQVDRQDVERALAAEHAREAIPMPDEDTGEIGADPEPLSGSEDRLLLAHSIRVLDERERRVVFLRFHADMTELEIARAVGISQAQVSRLLAGALAKLKERLADQPDTAPEQVISPGPAEKTAANLPDRRSSPTKIAPVGPVEQKAELERYLSLPYRVAVQSDSKSKRGSWVASVEELSGCEARGSTPDEAVEHLRRVMERWLSTALTEGREIPVPKREASKRKAASGHSGRFLVRMPSALHEELTHAAEREHVSLNRFVTAALAESVAAPGAGSSPQPVPAGVDEPPGAHTHRQRRFRMLLLANVAVIVVAAAAAVVLLILALQRGI
jgi:RNA polymerase sigma-B factor